MESSLPFALRVAAGLVSEAVGAVRRLPTDISTLPVTVIGKVAKLSFQLNQELTDLAASGDHLLAVLHKPADAPERTAWSTIDDEDEVAAKDPQAAATWDSVADAAKDVPGGFTVESDEPTPAAPAAPSGVPAATTARPKRKAAASAAATADSMDRALITDIGELENERPAPPVLVGLPHPDDTPDLDISTLTIAQLRARIRSLTVTQIRTALEQEQNGKARPAFLTVLTNRLSTVARGGE